MKFRAKLEDISILASITRIIHVIYKQSRELVIRLNETHMVLVCKEIKEGIQICAKLPARYIFTEYLCEGAYKDANEIYISLDSEKFLRTLKQINPHHAKTVKFKLTQKNINQYIEIVIEQMASNELITVSHDIPIDLISRKDWNFYDEVQINETKDIFYLPPHKHIKNVVDKQKILIVI